MRTPSVALGPPSASADAAANQSPHPSATLPRLDILTCRERSVMELLAEGRTAVAIAHRLAISPRTVHKHLENIYAKLGVADRLTAVLRIHEMSRAADGR